MKKYIVSDPGDEQEHIELKQTILDYEAKEATRPNG